MMEKQRPTDGPFKNVNLRAFRRCLLLLAGLFSKTPHVSHIEMDSAPEPLICVHAPSTNKVNSNNKNNGMQIDSPS